MLVQKLQILTIYLLVKRMQQTPSLPSLSGCLCHEKYSRKWLDKLSDEDYQEEIVDLKEHISPVVKEDCSDDSDIRMLHDLIFELEQPTALFSCELVILFLQKLTAPRFKKEFLPGDLQEITREILNGKDLGLVNGDPQSAATNLLKTLPEKVKQQKLAVLQSLTGYDATKLAVLIYLFQFKCNRNYLTASQKFGQKISKNFSLLNDLLFRLSEELSPFNPELADPKKPVNQQAAQRDKDGGAAAEEHKGNPAQQPNAKDLSRELGTLVETLTKQLADSYNPQKQGEFSHFQQFDKGERRALRTLAQLNGENALLGGRMGIDGLVNNVKREKEGNLYAALKDATTAHPHLLHEELLQQAAAAKSDASCTIM